MKQQEDGPYAWGYCFVRERNSPGAYCTSNQWPICYVLLVNNTIYGRGPVQLTRNYNYGQAGKAIGVDLINNPDLVATDPTIWFWMTPQANKPSSHNVIMGQWRPSDAERSAGRSGPGLRYHHEHNQRWAGVWPRAGTTTGWMIGLVSTRGTMTYWA
ncbi:hypothetical protein SLE2022_359310 [Rubroshorea leprosula]